VHRLGDVFVNDPWIFPPPLRVEMRIPHNVQSRLFGKVGIRRVEDCILAPRMSERQKRQNQNKGMSG
jgi:hypothetical protein